jgi:hypothetical protein
MVFLPDSPVTTRVLSMRERRIAVERLRENQTGVENKQFKKYQLIEALKDPKTYFFFLLGMIHNTPNGGISNFGTIIIKGFGFSTLVTTLLQVPYGVLIALFILSCVYLNDYFSVKLKKNTRCWFILIYTLPNIAGAFGLRYVSTDHHVARLWCYYLTGPYNAAFVLVLSLAIGNTAGHTKKVVTNAFLFLGYCTGECQILCYLGLLIKRRQHRWTVLLQDRPDPDLSTRDVEHDLLPSYGNRARAVVPTST